MSLLDQPLWKTSSLILIKYLNLVFLKLSRNYLIYFSLALLLSVNEQCIFVIWITIVLYYFTKNFIWELATLQLCKLISMQILLVYKIVSNYK